jgi:hypothetical protein
MAMVTTLIKLIEKTKYTILHLRSTFKPCRRLQLKPVPVKVQHGFKSRG